MQMAIGNAVLFVFTEKKKTGIINMTYRCRVRLAILRMEREER